MKKFYETPELEKLTFVLPEVICTSINDPAEGAGIGGGDGGEDED